MSDFTDLNGAEHAFGESEAQREVRPGQQSGRG